MKSFAVWDRALSPTEVANLEVDLLALEALAIKND